MICSPLNGRSAYQPNSVLPLPQDVLPCQQITLLVPSTTVAGAPLTTVEALGVRVWAVKFEAVSV